MTTREVYVPPKGLTDADLQAALADYLTTVQIAAAYAPIVHTHAISAITGLQTALDGKASSTHVHGNISNTGAIGTTANLPLITTTSGVVTTGAFGTAANTFCQGNDARLSDARTPLAHNQAWSTITSTPTTLSGYGITDAQPLDSDLTAIAALTTTTHGRSLLTGADAAATRSTIAAAGTGVFNNFVASQMFSSDIEFASGPRLRNNAGVLLVRNNADNARGSIWVDSLNATGFIVSTGGFSGQNDMYVQQDVFVRGLDFTDRVWLRGASGEVAALDRFLLSGLSGPSIDNSSGTIRFMNNARSGWWPIACGSVSVTGLVFLGSYSVSTLPAAAANDGAFARVVDATSSTNGTTAAGGGANKTTVFSNGTNWIIK